MTRFLLVMIILITGCQSKRTESQNENQGLSDKLINLAGKVVSEKVYDIDKDGNKRDLVLIIEGNMMYTSNQNGDKIELLLEKAGNKVYEIKHKVVDNIHKVEKGRILYVFEGDIYWEYEKEAKQKGNLAFVRKGNIIYQNSKKGLEKVLIVE